MSESTEVGPQRSLQYLSVELTNFLSFRSGKIELSDLIALVGPNSSGKSNAVAAIKLLRDIPIYGLPIAISRRGGYDQLRHRSSGRPFDPAIRINFRYSGEKISFYEIKFSSVKGKQYVVKSEEARVYLDGGEFWFHRQRDRYDWEDRDGSNVYSSKTSGRSPKVDSSQSALQVPFSQAGYLVSYILQATQNVEVNPSSVSELQDPSSTRDFEPDGSNLVSVLELFDRDQRAQLIDYIGAIVPGIVGYKIEHLADKVTVSFVQDEGSQGRREFYAKQMSDGTLRSFAIFVAMLQRPGPLLLIVEEPEVAIHLGALQTLVELLRSYSEDCQVVITTHSADILDSIQLDDIRVVWAENGSSHIARVAEHTRGPVRKGLITPGALLRADALDPLSA